MEDGAIIALYFDRNEQALAETDKKYGAFCRGLARSILSDARDSEECVNDAYLHLWNAIPPDRPLNLIAYIARVTRNAALDIFRKKNTSGRGRGQKEEIFEELSECLSTGANEEESAVDRMLLRQVMREFVNELPEENRIVFVQRYWYFREIKEISKDRRMSESQVKMILLRARAALKSKLEKEGFTI